MAAEDDVDWRERALRAEAALEQVRAERAGIWEENQRLRADAREVEYYRALADGMAGSVSWKVTTPLRSAKTVAGKVKRRLVTP